MPHRGIYWPQQRTLIVADLHWGKSETFAVMGVPLALGATDDELTRLDDAIAVTQAQRLLVLGDLVHGRAGLTPQVIARIGHWRASHDVALTLVVGNHDRHVRELPHEWRVDVVPGSLIEGPFRFCHHPEADPAHFTWAGHLHPTVKLEGGGDSLRLPCFALDDRVGVLPAFNAFTNGVVIDHLAGPSVYAIANDTVVAI